MILIQSPDGSEKQVVQSLKGYDGWTVLSQNTDMPEDDHDWCPKDKCWKPDVNRQKFRAKRRALRDPVQLMEIIDNLTARIEALEKKGNTK
jgi:hypothetical protein